MDAQQILNAMHNDDNFDHVSGAALPPADDEAGNEEIIAGLADREQRLQAMLDETEERCRHYAGVIDFYRARCLALASQLAACGDYDHKSKNEVLLRVVDSLLQLNLTNNTRDMLRDSIPF